MPLNRRMVETIVSHADLLREDTIPEPLRDLCAHVASYEPVVARWQQDGFDSVQPDDHVSIAGDFPRAELDAYVRSAFESLKLEQARLLAQLHRPGWRGRGHRAPDLVPNLSRSADQGALAE